jgi:hypothetical protein
MPKTYPHSLISAECEKKFNSFDVMECVINSLQLYYGKIKKEECDGKWVEIPPI